MKINIQSRLLLNKLSAISKVVSNKNAYAILDNFLFELTGGQLVITGSDMETRLTSVLDVPGAEGDGSFAIGIQRLIGLLKELPDTALAIEVDNETQDVTIRYLNGQAKMLALPGEDYPAKAVSDGQQDVFTIASKDVYDAIEYTLFAAGTDEMHPQFMGIFWDVKPDMITFVASDSHKLVRFVNARVKPGFERSFIMPIKPAQVLLQIIEKKSEEPVQIAVDATSATFTVGGFTLTCRFVNGRYPNYNTVIPRNNPYSVVVDRATILNALRRVAISASVSGLVKMQLQNQAIHMTTEDIDHATGGEETIVCEYDGSEIGRAHV